jgi:galactose-1-phosphate uridylyltransferase
VEDIETLSFPELVRLFLDEDGITDFLPDGVCQTDPRNGDRILFNSSRARRPHDNQSASSSDTQRAQPCVVCQGHTTGVVDVAELSEGFTFINKNLYPSLYPLQAGRCDLSTAGAHPPTGSVQVPCGLHFLQWTSSLHDKDWHNMPLIDRTVVMQRLAALEHKLVTGFRAHLAASESGKSPDNARGAVLIIKNYGHLVGGSLTHGHQQIGFSNIVPRRMHDDWRFEQGHGEKFSVYLLRENPAALVVRDYGPAVLLVPFFMRRPYDMMLIVKDAHKQHIFELGADEIRAVAEGWHDAIRVIRMIMPEIGKDIAYNVITHNGSGAGLYFEFLPYTQESGGFEYLGLFVCQANPESAAARIRRCLASSQGK